jgi:dihydroorotate dehydrogenase (fumarate)
MDLSTTYMGMKLSHPLIAGAGPLADDLDVAKRLADAGAAAIVMHSLFEEQIEREAVRTMNDMEQSAESSSEASSFFPKAHEFSMGPEHYLEQIRKLKRAVNVPVIASLNGTTPAGWLKYSELIEEAGADALELNLYYLPTDLKESGEQVEQRVVQSVRLVLESVKIPVAVKLSPFYSSIINLVAQLDQLGAKGLVLFNRIYQPEIDAELLDVVAKLELSTPAELPLRLRWMGILYGRVKASLAVSGGVHSPVDAVKAVMAGADVVQMTSALLTRGPEYISQLRKGMEDWMTEHFYKSVKEMRGSLSLKNCPDPSGYERANYARVLQSWRG